MQIKELVLYGKKGQKRTIAFNIGKVNIITGKSKSGKSAVGDIIEYCLGGSKCNIAEGVVRDNVSWYGLLLQFDANRIFIARKNPEVGQQSTSYCYYDAGADITSPERCDFESNTNVEGIEKLITIELGISENVHIPEDSESRLPLQANVRHALFYCFQSQDEIAARTSLFHRQAEEPFVSQSIKDTLPYFLGAVNEEAISLVTERRSKERQLKLLRRELNEKNSLTGTGSERAVGLLAEAVKVGLISSETGIDKSDFNALYSALSKVELVTTAITSDSLDQLSKLQTQLEEKQEEVRLINNSILEAQKYIGDATGYNDEIIHQKVRLESIGLFEKLDFDAGKCPLCSGQLNPEPPSISLMKESIIALDKAISRVEKERPKLRRYIDQQEQTADAIRGEISHIKASIDGVYEQWENAKKIKDLNARKAAVYGRISYWLDNVKPEPNSNDLEQKIKLIETRIDEIDSILSNDSIKDRTYSALSVIQTYMTDWAKSLAMEYTGHPYRIDISKATVVVDTNRPVVLREMGSASNWLGAHLISMFGLHKFFITNKRPVPNFIFLDQPSQVYFPEGTTEEDMDIKAVEDIYNFIFERADDSNGKLQVIIVDHAKLETDVFKANTVEEWRDPDDNLIPVSWYK